MAATQRVRHDRPMLLTEHGIYSRERRMEIDQAEWIYVQRQAPMTLSLSGPGFFKELRPGSSSTSRASLRPRRPHRHDLRGAIAAGPDPRRGGSGQDAGGAERHRHGAARRAAAAEAGAGEFRIGFVGRVVPIKDVEDRSSAAVKIVSATLPGRAR